MDFNGIPFKANYVVDYPPYCYIDKDNKLKGIMPDIMREAALLMNITLLFQAPKTITKTFGPKSKCTEFIE